MDNYISIFHKEVTLKYLIFPPVLAGVVENVWAFASPVAAFILLFNNLPPTCRCWNTPLKRDIIWNFSPVLWCVSRQKYRGLGSKSASQETNETKVTMRSYLCNLWYKEVPLYSEVSLRENMNKHETKPFYSSPSSYITSTTVFFTSLHFDFLSHHDLFFIGG